MEEVKIQIRFTIRDEETGVDYTDALYLTPQEFNDLSDEEKQAMKQERFDNWKKVIKEAQHASTPDAIDNIVAIDEQVDALIVQRAQAVKDAATEKGVEPSEIESQVEDQKANTDKEG